MKEHSYSQDCEIKVNIIRQFDALVNHDALVPGNNLEILPRRLVLIRMLVWRPIAMKEIREFNSAIKIEKKYEWTINTLNKLNFINKL